MECIPPVRTRMEGCISLEDVLYHNFNSRTKNGGLLFVKHLIMLLTIGPANIRTIWEGDGQDLMNKKQNYQLTGACHSMKSVWE